MPKATADPIKIYLAGKVSGIKWTVVKPFITPLMDEEVKFEFYSSDGGNHSEHDWGGGFPLQYDESSLRDGVQDQMIDIMRQCNLVIAVLDRPDSYGLIAEIAWASAMGLPVLLIIIDPHWAHCQLGGEWPFPKHCERMHDAYWFIAHFPLVKAVVVEKATDATFYLRAYLYRDDVIARGFVELNRRLEQL